MNIVDILKQKRYEIVEERYMKYFRIKFTEDKRKEMLDKVNCVYDFDLYGEFDVEIKEVGFDGEGDLYIVLHSMGDEHFDIGDCFDVITVPTDRKEREDD